MTREELRDYVEEQRSLNNIPYHVYSELIDGIDTLEQELKTGRWIRGKYTEDDIRYHDSSYKCSECGRVVDVKENFCPNCGFRMVEPQESEVKNEDN